MGAASAAVVYPCSADALGGALDAAAAGLIAPILIGPRKRILAQARALGGTVASLPLIDASSPMEAAQAAAGLARDGRVQLLMKGSLHTDELMSVVIARAAGLRTARRVTHVMVMDVPSHDRLLLITDAAVNIAPDVDVKRDIVRNAIDVAHALRIRVPRVALLSAVETVNSAIPSTMDAAAIKRMADAGAFTGAIVDGPLAFDNAISRQAARIKGIRSPVAGRVDILVVPTLEAGNMLYKQLVWMSGALAAGVVVGATIPIILTSRADSRESRIVSAAVASLLAGWQRKRA